MVNPVCDDSIMARNPPNAAAGAANRLGNQAPGDTTLMTIRHDQLPAPVVEQHESGWSIIGDQLAARLA